MKMYNIYKVVSVSLSICAAIAWFIGNYPFATYCLVLTFYTNRLAEKEK